VTIRVVIVDDQTLVRAGLRMILQTQADLEVVGEAADGAAGVELVRRLAPDVALFDIRMPVCDGVSATRQLSGEPTRVVMLTTYDLDEYLFEALEAGAVGFMLKDVAPEDLLDGIRQVAAGESLLAPSATRRLIAEFIDQRRREKRDRRGSSVVDGLTTRETEVLGLMARGLSNSEIADALFVGDNTVKTHVGHILDKLGARDRVQAVIAAYEAGLVEPGPAELS
jgi:DNA-binding NarL/FixJ family response regulator